MASDDQFTRDMSILRRRKGIGPRRRRPGGSELTGSATPFLGWRGAAGGGAVAEVSARRLAAALWRLAATTNGSRFKIPKIAAEGDTKWDERYSKASDDVNYFRSHLKFHKSRDELNEEEEPSRITTEHENLCSIANNLKNGVKRERKACKKIDSLNSKLLHDIAEAKLSARKIKKNLEKEKKARVLLEDVYDVLAKQIEANKAEIGALRNEQERIGEEVERERKMLQLAEAWNEEITQMKLVDAKLILEDKFGQMNNLIADLETFSRRSNLTSNPGRSDHKFANCKSQRSECSGIWSVSLKQPKEKVSYACKLKRCLPRNKDTCKTTVIDGSRRLSNGSVSSTVYQASPQRVWGDGAIDSHDPATCQSERRNPHVVRAMKGHIEWPRGKGMPRQGLVAKHLEAKLESQKMLWRRVLKR